MIRIRFVVGTADSEYGCACHHMPRFRKRQCRNWPPDASSLSRCRPVMVTETTPGASSSTEWTVTLCWRLRTIGRPQR